MIMALALSKKNPGAFDKSYWEQSWFTKGPIRRLSRQRRPRVHAKNARLEAAQGRVALTQISDRPAESILAAQSGGKQNQNLTKISDSSLR